MKANGIKAPAFDYLFCFLILAIPFSLKVPNILLIILGLFFILDLKAFRKAEFKKLQTTPYIILSLLVIYWTGKSILTNTIQENKISLLIPVVLIPILILKVEKYNRILIAVLITGFIIASRALYGVLNNYIQTKELLPFEGNTINTVLNMERPYLGFFLVIASTVGFYMAVKIQRFRIVLILYVCYLIAVIFLISARLSLITVSISIIFYFLFFLKISILKKTTYCSFAIVLVGLLFLWNKNLRDRLFIADSYEQSIENFKRHEPRFIIWPCAYSISTSEAFNKVIGLKSEQELKKALTDCYELSLENKHRAQFFISSELNTHNQFLGTFLTSGYIGLVLLIAFFVSQFRQIGFNFVKIALLVALFLFFAVENVLNRQTGMYFFAMIGAIINIVPLQIENRCTD